LIRESNGKLIAPFCPVEGKAVRSVDLGWPITGSPTHSDGAIYLQTLGAVLHSLDLDGKERWRWDHYPRFVEPKPERFKGTHPGGYDGPHFGGGEVAVSGRRVVTSFGWDHVCVEDRGTEAAPAWCNRAALGKDDGIPMFSSISAGFVYTGWPGVDGAGTLLRVSMADGSFDPKKDPLGRDRWAIWGTPAARDSLVVFGRHVRGVTAYEYGKGTAWESFRWSDPAGFTPVVGSPALAKDHALFGTVDGELVAVPLAGPKGAFRWKTPHGRFINSAPAISRGHVFFGCDDGHLYVLGPGGSVEPSRDPVPVHERRSRSTAGARYAWPSPYGGPSNANFVRDPSLVPPLRLRWAARSHGVFVSPLSATEEDLVGVKLEGAQGEAHGCAEGGILVFSGGGRKDPLGETVAIEPGSGRVLWRSTESHCGYRGTPSARDGRVYLSGWDVPVTCVSAADGKVLWKTDQKMHWGHVPALGPDYFTGRGYSGHAVAWRLEDGKPKRVDGKQILLGGPDHACGPVLLTSGGHSIAVTVSGLHVRDASTGRMLWQSPGFAPRSCSSPIAASGRVFYNPQVNGMLYCFEPAK
jgi:outer membrane protein assembly factor BamB